MLTKNHLRRLTLFIFVLVPLIGISYRTDAALSKPDLTVESIAISPLQPAVDQKATITITGKYYGPTSLIYTDGIGSAQPDFTNFFLDSSVLPSYQPVPSASSPVEDGSTYTYTYVGTFTNPGQQRLTFTIDYAAQLNEYEENNNKLTAYVTVFNLYDLPDVALTSLDVQPVVPKAGEAVTVTVHGTYKGSDPLKSAQGIGDTTFSFQDFTPTTSGPPQPTPVPSVDVPLSSGGTFRYTVTGSFSSGGVKQLTFTSDFSNQLYESSETNNTATLNVTVVNASTTPENPPEPEPVPEPAPTESDWSKIEEGLVSAVDRALVSRLKGRILLQTEEHGEAWYVNPVDGKKYYFKDGPVAYQALRAFGAGITDADIAGIPVGLETRFADSDADADGLPDKLEEGLGTDPADTDSDDDGVSDGTEVLSKNTNPLGSGALVYRQSLRDRLRGKILLQVQSRGEAWYVNPVDGKRYYMKNGEAAYQIMRFLSLGISNIDLRHIAVGMLSQ